MPSIIAAMGFEWGVSPPVANLIGGTNGTPTVENNGRGGNSNYSLRINPTATSENVTSVLFAATNIFVGSVWIKFNGSIPAGDALLMEAAGGNGPALAFRGGVDQKFCICKNNAGTFADISPIGLEAAVADRWYLIDFYYDCSSNPWIMKATVDGKGLGTSNSATAAYATQTRWRFGTGQTFTFDASYDDFVLSNSTADWPLGAYSVDALSPASDGTHNAGTNIIEDGALNDIGVVPAWPLLDDMPLFADGAADRVQETTTGAANYAEVKFAQLAQGRLPQWVGGYLNWGGQGTTANNGACIVIRNDATQISLRGTPAAPAAWNVTGSNFDFAIITAPGSGWTVDEVNALKSRMGYSSDANPDVYFYGLLLEVALKDEQPMGDGYCCNFPPIDETFDEVHEYFGHVFYATDAGVVEPDFVWPEAPQIDETYITDENLYDGLAFNIAEVGNEDFQQMLEFPQIDDVYDPEHDYAGLAYFPTPDDVFVPETFGLDLPQIDDVYDPEHDYTGWAYFVTPDDVFAPETFGVELPQVDETYDVEHEYFGHSFFISEVGNEDFQQMSEVPEIDETYDVEYDYAGMAFNIAEVGNEDFRQMLELPQIDETYDVEHTYDGFASFISEVGNEDFQQMLEAPQVDETYDVEHTYDGWSFFITPDDIFTESPLVAEWPQIDESYDVVYEFDGWAYFPTPADVIAVGMPVYDWPQIDETYYVEHDYTGHAFFPYGAWVAPEAMLHARGQDRDLIAERGSQNMRSRIQDYRIGSAGDNMNLRVRKQDGVLRGDRK